MKSQYTLAKIGGYEKCKSLEGNLSNTWIPFCLMAPKHVKTCGAKKVLLSVAFLKLNNVSCDVKNERLDIIVVQEIALNDHSNSYKCLTITS